MIPAGFNPMRWDCEVSGCFNLKRRPKLEVFAGCFPRRINFGDVDGMLELSGRFCLLEWKGEGGSLRRGQELAFQRLTSGSDNVVFVVRGDAETMEVRSYSMFQDGLQGDFLEANLEDVRTAMSEWAERAKSERR